jgi:protocatechuate 3,4-dioxygenase beta subunit
MLIAVGLLVGIMLVILSKPPDVVQPDSSNSGSKPGGDTGKKTEIPFKPKSPEWERIKVDDPDLIGKDMGVIRGHVYDLDGNPLHLAEVFKQNEEWRHKKTGPDGYYELPLPTGTHLIKAVKTGYSANGSVINRLEAGDVIEGVDIYLGPGADARGHIVSLETGQGITGAMVRLYCSTREANSYNRSAQETTNASGRVDFKSLGLYTYSVRVRHDEYYIAGADNVQITIEQGKVAEFTVEMTMGGVITGTVTDERGEPLPEARLWVSAAPNSPFPGPYRNVTSGPDGRYRIAGLKSGDFKLHCHKQGYVRKEEESIGVVAGEVVDNIDFQLSTGGYVSGMVTSAADGMPIEGATVTVYGNGNYGNTRTDAEGQYRITGLQDGTFTVTANAYDKGYLMERQSGISADSMSINIALTRGGTLRGTVEIRRELPGFSIRLVEQEVPEGKQPFLRSQYFRTKDGSFEMKNLKPGIYTVRAMARNFADGKPETIQILAEQETDVRLELGAPGANPTPAPRIIPDSGSRKVNQRRITPIPRNFKEERSPR